MAISGIKVSSEIEHGVCEAYLNGAGMPRVARQFDLSVKGVYRILGRCGIRCRKQGTPIDVQSKICDMYANGDTQKAISGKVGICVETVRKILKKHEVRIRFRDVLTKDQESEVIASYLDRKTSGEIARSYGVDVGTIFRVLRDAGISSRCGRDRSPWQTLDETAFDEVTEESAYWIGFLMADGCVSRSGNSYSLILSLASRDVGHVEKFRRFLSSSCSITRTDPKIHFSNGKPINSTGSVRISVSSNRLCEALMRFGVVPRKSPIARVIGLESNRDFWRGVIDGDGSLYFSDGCPNVYLCGSSSLVAQFADFARLILPWLEARPRPAWNAKFLQRMNVHGRGAVALIRVLYDGASVSLDRKAEIARGIMDNPPYDDM